MPRFEYRTLELSRRAFFQRAVAGSVAGGVLAGISPAAWGGAVKRNGKPHFKLSLAAYSFREALSGKSPSMTLDDFVRLCADLNLEGCELTSYYFPKDFQEDYLMHLKELTFKLGLGISGVPIANDFCLPPGPQRSAALAHTRKWIDNAALLGAPVIRIFAGYTPKGDTEEAAIARCAQGINESLEHAAKKGVVLALENHGGITESAAQMLKIIAQVKDSPFFGVNLDTGNFRSTDPYADIARMAPYAVTVQVKSEIFEPLVPGAPPINRPKTIPADLPRIMQILRSANYRGYVALEYEGPNPKTTVPQLIEKLRTLSLG